MRKKIALHWHHMATMTPKALDQDMKAFIAISVKETLEDPDFGLDLSETTKRRLREVKSKKQNMISHAEIKRRLY